MRVPSTWRRLFCDPNEIVFVVSASSIKRETTTSTGKLLPAASRPCGARGACSMLLHTCTISVILSIYMRCLVFIHASHHCRIPTIASRTSPAPDTTATSTSAIEPTPRVASSGAACAGGSSPAPHLASLYLGGSVASIDSECHLASAPRPVAHAGLERAVSCQKEVATKGGATTRGGAATRRAAPEGRADPTAGC